MKYYMATLALKHIETNGDACVFKLIEAGSLFEATETAEVISEDINKLEIHKVMFIEIRPASKEEVVDFKREKKPISVGLNYNEIPKKKLAKIKREGVDNSRKVK